MRNDASPAAMAKITAAWLKAARAEHAAVASFARLTLHLMHAAAPPRLLTDSLQAGIDEVDHARRAFALASRFGEAPVGPGAFPLHGDPLGPLDLASITEAAVVEGCVGETISALMAQEAASLATDPQVHETLTVIAEDESRHAELSWRVVRWALSIGDATVRAAAHRGFDRAWRPTDPPPAVDADRAALNRYGCLTARQRHAVAVEAWAEVVLPAVDALFSTHHNRLQGDP
jgi:hypothetical protein